MDIKAMLHDDDEMKPRITVFGVGGAGGNAVNNMIEKQLEGVEFVVANTDAQALNQSRTENRVQIGPKLTSGLGAGAKPAIGAAAAEETIEEIVDHLSGSHMCFITAGMGGGTGTGAAPIIAHAAREMNILTVGVVTKPFEFEGRKRMKQAEEGIINLQKVVDTLIIIPNQNLFRLASEKTTFSEAFALADDVLYQGVKGVTDLMVRPGIINLDFADVRSVMDEMGKAMMGTGEASGENRAVQAAEKAIANPLLDDISLKGAKGVLINVTSNGDMTLFEFDEAANVIRREVDEDANIIVGSTIDPDMDGAIRVSVVATGIDSENAAPKAEAAQPAAAQPQQPAATHHQQAHHQQAPHQSAQYQPAPHQAGSYQGGTQAAAEPTPAQQPSQDRGLFDDAGDVPAPGYRPQPRAAAPSGRHPLDHDAGDFVAPPSRGVASPEAEARLSRILQQTQTPQAEPQQRSASRMQGLSRMLERVTGQHEAARPAPATTAERVHNRMNALKQADFDNLEQPESSQDRVEIPAFLRRQAN